MFGSIPVGYTTFILKVLAFPTAAQLFWQKVPQTVLNHLSHSSQCSDGAPEELQDRRLQRQLLHELEFLRQVFEATGLGSWVSWAGFGLHFG